MKIALTIVCSLLLIWAQAVSAQIPAQGKTACCPMANCPMPCCKAAPAPERAPFDATVSAASQQILSPVPVTVVWVWSVAGTSSIAPASSIFLTAQSAHVFARNCVRLL
ncbi:MAG TPA: hypothetical protein VK742_20195 [Candidatus Sulfotelmatobacter sp.]|nr:hypothetical protein [Candidatus Sulfotelmatobacter sp.]